MVRQTKELVLHRAEKERKRWAEEAKEEKRGGWHCGAGRLFFLGASVWISV